MALHLNDFQDPTHAFPDPARKLSVQTRDLPGIRQCTCPLGRGLKFPSPDRANLKEAALKRGCLKDTALRKLPDKSCLKEATLTGLP